MWEEDGRARDESGERMRMKEKGFRSCIVVPSVWPCPRHDYAISGMLYRLWLQYSSGRTMLLPRLVHIQILVGVGCVLFQAGIGPMLNVFVVRLSNLVFVFFAKVYDWLVIGGVCILLC